MHSCFLQFFVGMLLSMVFWITGIVKKPKVSVEVVRNCTLSP